MDNDCALVRDGSRGGGVSSGEGRGLVSFDWQGTRTDRDKRCLSIRLCGYASSRSKSVLSMLRVCESSQAGSCDCCDCRDAVIAVMVVMVVIPGCGSGGGGCVTSDDWRYKVSSAFQRCVAALPRWENVPASNSRGKGEGGKARGEGEALAGESRGLSPLKAMSVSVCFAVVVVVAFCFCWLVAGGWCRCWWRCWCCYWRRIPTRRSVGPSICRFARRVECRLTKLRRGQYPGKVDESSPREVGDKMRRTAMER